MALRTSTLLAEPALLTVREAAVALGLSRHTIRSWTYSGKIPYVRVGGKAVRIARETIDSLIASGYTDPSFNQTQEDKS